MSALSVLVFIESNTSLASRKELVFFVCWKQVCRLLAHRILWWFYEAFTFVKLWMLLQFGKTQECVKQLTNVSLGIKGRGHPLHVCSPGFFGSPSSFFWRYTEFKHCWIYINRIGSDMFSGDLNLRAHLTLPQTIVAAWEWPFNCFLL